MDPDRCEVFKVGQRTGPTIAKLSDIEARVILEDDRERLGDQFKFFEGTREYAVYLDRKKKGSYMSFADKGDSGSWIFTSSGEWFGMVFGCCWRVDRNVVYVTSAEMLKTHIEQKTNCEVSLP